MTRKVRKFHVHGDNIVECNRVFDYIVASLSDLIYNVAGPKNSVTCPVFTVSLVDIDLEFEFLPGYGKHRWNQDVLNYIRQNGGRLREAADAVVTLVDKDSQLPILAVEFCGALPAGNQAWQRQGRAFSFAHANIPYFYVTGLGGFELNADRKRKAERLPNPAIPFSFLTMTKYTNSVCLPVYEPNAGATKETVELYKPIFGRKEFLEFLRFVVLDDETGQVAVKLGDKCIALVKLLANARSLKGNLTENQLHLAYNSIKAGQSLLDFLDRNPHLPWKKTRSISSITDSANDFMELGAIHSFGLVSSSLPLSFVPKSQRPTFSRKSGSIYPDVSDNFLKFLAKEDTHLAIAWVMGFKPKGDDARPDRGLPPFARMLVGEDCDLLTFVYGPVPEAHWNELGTEPERLVRRNGLWEAIFSISDGVLIDNSNKPIDIRREYLKGDVATSLIKIRQPLGVNATVLKLGEQDVDTALHVLFRELGEKHAFEGMCNPPGGDWSGISFRFDNAGHEYRWLTLPRVTSKDEKRPDHIVAIFGAIDRPVCLSIESKERAQQLKKEIGSHLKKYSKNLLKSEPSVFRRHSANEWINYNTDWELRDLDFVSAGAHLSFAADPFGGLPKHTSLDVQISIEFSKDSRECTLHMQGITETGRSLADFLSNLASKSKFFRVQSNN